MQLKHYAEFRIRGAILDSLRAGDWSPRALRRQARRIEAGHFRCKARSWPRSHGAGDRRGNATSLWKTCSNLLGELRGLDIGSLQAESTSAGRAGRTLQLTAGVPRKKIHSIRRCARK